MDNALEGRDVVQRDLDRLEKGVDKQLHRKGSEQPWRAESCTEVSGVSCLRPATDQWARSQEGKGWDLSSLSLLL